MSLSDLSMEYFFQSLSNLNRTLKELILSNNQITDQGFIYLSNLFKSNKILITIGLQNNLITDQSIEYLANILSSYSNSIENLSLYSNQGITDSSIQSFINIINKKHPLKYLWIEDCQLSQQGKEKLIQSIPSHLHLSLIPNQSE